MRLTLPPSAAASRTMPSILNKSQTGPEERGKRWWNSCFPLLFWLLVWAAAAALVERGAEMGGELLLPGPLPVGRALSQLLFEGWFWRTALRSLGRMAAGIVLGTLAGVLLAVVTAAWPWCDALFSPAIRVIRAVPVTSFILLVLLWTSRDQVPVLISALMVLPVIWAAMRQGIAGVDTQLLELARCYRLDRWRQWKLVWFPAIRPAFSTGLATATGLAWKAGVAAEVLCQPKQAIGSEIYRAKYTLDTPGLFAWTLVVILLSLLMERGVKWSLERGLRRAGSGTGMHGVRK